MMLIGTIGASGAKKQKVQKDLWPDGTEISEWFKDTTPVDISKLGKQYVLTENRIFADGKVHTAEIQALIDKAAANGGGVIVVPEGTYITGGLHFKQGTHLYLKKGATLMGSDFIGDYPLGKTRMEGETCTYFGALINADGLDGFTISGEGTIDGNGLKYHQQFWLRRKWNRQCTNKDEQRPRLIYISNCKNVQVEGITTQNSAFWTNHVYNSENVKYLGVKIYSLGKPDDSKGPSTDAIDLDVLGIQNLEKCWSEELARSSTAATWLVHVVRVQCSKTLFNRKVDGSRSSAVLPGENVIPPLLSVTVESSVTFNDNVLSILDQETWVHCPAVDTFPTCIDWWIGLKVIDEIKDCTVFENQVCMGWNVCWTYLEVTFWNHNSVLACILSEDLVQVITLLECISCLVELSWELELDSCRDEWGDTVKIVCDPWFT